MKNIKFKRGVVVTYNEPKIETNEKILAEAAEFEKMGEREADLRKIIAKAKFDGVI